MEKSFQIQFPTLWVGAKFSGATWYKTFNFRFDHSIALSQKHDFLQTIEPRKH